MPLARREPHDVARMNFLLRSVPTLRPAATRRYDQRLAEGMRVPRGAGTWLEGGAENEDSCRFGGVEERIVPN